MRWLSLAAVSVAAAGLCQGQSSSDPADDPVAPSAPSDGNVQTSEYQSDAARLLRVVGSALYHDKSAFLRELVSNAADALEKYRLIALTEGVANLHEQPLNVSIRPVQDGRLVITDSGIGMTREELASNLGTIARSGTSEFLSKLSSSQTTAEQASGLIGRFGLGFYSSFLVADKVVVASKSYQSDEQYVFESATAGLEGDGSSFKIYKDPRGTTLGSHGTEITLWLNSDAQQYLNAKQLQVLIQQHAEFSTGDAPIYVWTEDVTSEAQEPDSAGSEDGSEDGPAKVAVFKRWWKQINDQAPIWMRDAKSLTDEDYKTFYRSAFKDAGASEPLIWSHFKGDAGATSFRALIYLPGDFSPDYYQKTYQDLHSLKLYVRRVFITGDLGPTFIPKWLNWLKVVVDADDLPLNVGRDSLQKTASLVQIQRTLTRKTLDMIGLAAKEDADRYNTKIWPTVGLALKLGVIEDAKSMTKLSKLLRFDSSSTTGPTLSLDDYVAKRRQGQTQIYFIAGAGMEKKDLQKSPFVEDIEARGYEILYFTDPIDELLAQRLGQYDGMRFQDVAKQGVKYGDEDNASEKAELEATYQPVIDYLKSRLSENVKQVVISTQLTTSPCAILADQGAWTANMERLAAAQNSKGGGQQDDFMRMMMKTQKRILQINAKHPLIEGLLDKLSEFDSPEEAAKDDDLNELVNILYDTSLVRSGFTVREPSEYFSRIESILRRSLGVSESAKAKYTVKPAPPIEEGPVKPAVPDLPTDTPLGGAGEGGAIPEWADWEQIKRQMEAEKGVEDPADELDFTHDEL